VEAQRDGNKIKNFFRQSEMTTLLRDCWKGLQQGMEVFEVSKSREQEDITHHHTD
jgi:hypothetical protein